MTPAGRSFEKTGEETLVIVQAASLYRNSSLDAKSFCVRSLWAFGRSFRLGRPARVLVRWYHIEVQCLSSGLPADYFNPSKIEADLPGFNRLANNWRGKPYAPKRCRNPHWTVLVRIPCPARGRSLSDTADSFSSAAIRTLVVAGEPVLSSAACRNRSSHLEILSRRSPSPQRSGFRTIAVLSTACRIRPAVCNVSWRPETFS